MKKFYLIVLLITLLYLFKIFLIDHMGYSESRLVMFTYFWFPALAFSIVGLATLKKQGNIKFAIAGAIGSLGLLMMFFSALWPLL